MSAVIIRREHIFVEEVGQRMDCPGGALHNPLDTFGYAMPNIDGEWPYHRTDENVRGSVERIVPGRRVLRGVWVLYIVVALLDDEG